MNQTMITVTCRGLTADVGIVEVTAGRSPATAAPLAFSAAPSFYAREAAVAAERLASLSPPRHRVSPSDADASMDLEPGQGRHNVQ